MTFKSKARRENITFAQADPPDFLNQSMGDE